jgi:hypothetical protein
MTKTTVTTDDLLALLTGAKIGAATIELDGTDSALLRASIERVERQLLELVDAALPTPANPLVDQLAAKLLTAFDAAPQQTEQELAIHAGLDQHDTSIALARLEADGKVWQLDDAGTTIWSRA